MVAALCEEVPNPHLEVPRAITLSVVAAAITGIIYLLPILFVLPSVQSLLSVANGQPIGLLFKDVTGSAAGGFGLLFLILGIQLFAGIGALTACSRCTYAFARDGAIPGSKLWRRVNTRFDIPLWGLILSVIVDCLLGLIYFGSSAAFNSFTGAATICLSWSYGLPILVSVLRGRKAVKHSSYSLGRFGYAINIVTIIWIIFSIVLFCMPYALPVTSSSMNYASVVFVGFGMIAVVYYFARARKTFKGPPVLSDAPADAVGVVAGEKVDDEARPGSHGSGSGVEKKVSE